MENAKHIVRALILLGVIAGFAFYLRTNMVPQSFGKYGNYRADALQEHRSKEIIYRTTPLCNNCHPKIVKTRTEGRHLSIHCEDCHGPGTLHTDWEGKEVIGTMTIDRSRENCLVCHKKLRARPAEFPQIDLFEHLKDVGVGIEDTETLCIKCHNPHHPTENEMLCGNCHPKEVSLREQGGHRAVYCQECHGPIKGHCLIAGMEKLRKDISRENCSKCHEENGQKPSSFPQVNTIGHLVAGGVEPTDHTRLCVHCHNPHLPKDDTKLCAFCHKEKIDMRAKGAHRALKCEECHSPVQGHLRFKDRVMPVVSRSRENCARCHEEGEKPFVKGIKQINIAVHLQGDTETMCVDCHNPHSPHE